MSGRGRGAAERVSATALAALGLALVAWTVFAVGAWALVPAACDRGGSVLLHVGVAATMLVAAVGGAGAWRLYREDERAGRRPSELTVAALFLSALFIAGIALSWVFTVSFDPCWR